MRLGWDDLDSGIDGAVVAIDGFVTAAATANHVLLVAEPACCVGCVPRNTAAAVEVFLAVPIPMRGQRLRLTGTWRVAESATGWRYQLHGACPREPAGWSAITRRGLVAAGPLICLAGPGDAQAVDLDATRLGVTVDIHSHAGGVAGMARIRSGEGFGRIAEPMRRGGMAAICLAIVSDSPTHRISPEGRIRPHRDPEPGELYTYAQLAFRRVHDLLLTQGVAVVTTSAALRNGRADRPSAIISAEGADFLEGRIERVDEAYAHWSLRHLQLTHYRVNELGDIQTEPPVHHGLTDFGAEVIRRCNRLGIVVDVAHATEAMVQRAATVTTKPLVLSHTSLRSKPARFSRRISPEHARLIAETGGVIGVWPPSGEFGSLAALAAGMAQLVDVVGIDHVGLGTDMRGLVGGSVIPDYDHIPALVSALRDASFSPGDVAKIMGGNYLRVFVDTVS